MKDHSLQQAQLNRIKILYTENEETTFFIVAYIIVLSMQQRRSIFRMLGLLEG
jgi:hypothetical protein